ncbi:hypothetical protein ACLOJK_037006 [Asimina triloba]
MADRFAMTSTPTSYWCQLLSAVAPAPCVRQIQPAVGEDGVPSGDELASAFAHHVVHAPRSNRRPCQQPSINAHLPPMLHRTWQQPHHPQHQTRLHMAATPSLKNHQATTISNGRKQ